MKMNEMDRKQEDKKIKKKKSDLIINNVSMVVMLILFGVQMICGFHGASKYIIAAFDPCYGLIALVLILRSNNHGTKKVVGIIVALILIVIFPLIYILTN